MRKKFTMLLALVLCAFASNVMAQATYYRPGARTTTLEVGKQYFISAATFYNNARPNLLYNDNGKLAYSDKKPNALTDDAAYLFTVVKIGANNIYYITNSEGKYLQANTLDSDAAEKGVTIVPYSKAKGGIACGSDVQACDESGNKIEYNNITDDTPIVCVYHNNSTGWRHISDLQVGKSTPFAFYEVEKVFPEITTDESNPKWYTIKNVRGNAYAYYDGTGTAMGMSGMVDKAAYLFYFTKGTTEGTYKIHNYVNSKLCAAPNSWTDGGIDWYIQISGSSAHPGLAISKEATLTAQGDEAWNDFQNKHTSVNWYGGNDDGSTWQIDRYEFESILPTIQLSTKDNIVLHYIRSQRRTNFVNFDGHNVTFKEGNAGLSSYWYFVQDEEAQKNAPKGFVACRIYNAAHATGVENHSSGYMGDDSWPARVYYIGTGEYERNGYLIYRADANLENNGYGCWHDSQGKNIMDYHKNDAGSYWRIYPSETTSADLIQQAEVAKANALNKVALYEYADYYTYTDDAIAKAMDDVSAVNVGDITAAVQSLINSPFQPILTTLESTQNGQTAPVSGDIIQLKNKKDNKYLKANDADAENTDKQNDLATLWSVEAGEGNYVKLKNVSTNEYIGQIRRSKTVAMQAEVANAAQFEWTNQAGVYTVFKDVNTEGVSEGDLNFLYGHVNGGKLVGWEPNADATQWLVSKVYRLEIVYNLNGVKLGTATEYVKNGTVYTISSPYDFTILDAVTVNEETFEATDGVFSFWPTKSATVTVELKEDLPFEYADSKGNITQWYYLKFHAIDRNYLYYAADGEVLKTDKTAVDGDKDAYTWAFVGDFISGFKVYNKKAEKYLDAVESGAVVSADQEQVFTLTSSSYAPKGFFMQAKDGDYKDRFNRQGGKVVYWSGADAGSTFIVELRPKEGFAAAEELLAANEDNHSDTPALGQYTTAAYNALKAANEDLNATAESIEEAIVAFKASLNRPVYLITSAWNDGYPAGSAIYYDDVWMWKEANKFDRQMWMTIPGYTDKDVPSVQEYNMVGTHYGLCDYLTGTKMRDLDVQFVAISGWPEAYNLQYGTNTYDAAMHAADTRELVGWNPATLSDCQASAWKVEYLGNSYNLSKLADEKLEALAGLQAAFDSKSYLFNATYGDGLGQYQGDGQSIYNTLMEAASVLYSNLNVMADEAYTVEKIQDMTNALNTLELTINMPEDGKYYRIWGANSNVKPAGHYITNHTNSVGGRIALTEDATNATTIYQYKDGKLQAYENGKYIGLSSSHWTFADDAASASVIVFAASSYVAGAYTIKSADRYLRYKVFDGKVEIDRTESEGSANDAWFLQEIRMITYVYKAGKSELARQEVMAGVGAPYPEPTAELPLGYVAPTSLDGTVGADDTEKVIACTFDKSKMPFQYADKYENIEHWYYLNIATDGYYLFHDANATYIALNSKTVDLNKKDAYSWAFVGNPTDGFKLYNKAAGSGMILSSSTTMSGTTGDSTFPVMTAEATLPAGNNTYWIYTKSGYRANKDGFYLAQKDNLSNKMNNRGNKLAYWNGGADDGSTFVVVEQYEMTQPYSGIGSWEQSPVYPEGLKNGATSGSHGSAADHVGAAGHTIYKSAKAVVTTDLGVHVSFNYVTPHSHGLSILGVDVVNGNGDVVASDYHVGFTGGAQDKKEYTLSGFPAGNYILRYYVCNKSGDHDLNHTGGDIVVNFAKELTDVDAVSEMWTTLKKKGQSVLDHKGEGIGYYNNAENVEVKIAATPENTVASYTAAFVALDDAIDSTPFALPEAGKFYRIKSKVASRYVTAPANTGVQMIMSTETSVNNILYLDSEKHLLVYGTGYYINGKNHAVLGYKDTYTFEASKNGVKGALAIKPGTQNYWHDNNEKLDAYQNGTHANCDWIVEEVTTLPVTVTAAQVNFNGATKCVSTLFAPVVLEVPAGITAYIGVNEDNYLAMEPIEEGIIPANTGVILMADEAKTYDFVISSEAGTAIEAGDNIIAGTVAKTIITPAANTTCYVLAKKDEKVGLYRASLNKNDGKGFINNACKAYIPVETPAEQAAPALVMRFGRGQGTTEIELATDNGQQPTAVYDLQGRRVLNPTKGMYIVNGKKVVIR